MTLSMASHIEQGSSSQKDATDDGSQDAYRLQNSNKKRSTSWTTKAYKDYETENFDYQTSSEIHDPRHAPQGDGQAPSCNGISGY